MRPNPRRSVLAALSLAVIAAAVACSSPASDRAKAQGACAGLVSSPVDGAAVTTAVFNSSGSQTPPPDQDALRNGTATGLPAFCEVTLLRADPGGNRVTEVVWLPAAGWNGRFQGVGGGGYACGITYGLLARALREGYASASSDCGHQGGTGDGAFLLTTDGRTDEARLKDFAYEGMHWMTLDAQAVVQRFYGRVIGHSYFNGCSNGGRQALVEAQRFPGDYNGVLAGAPALDWAKLIPADLWPEVVMQQSGDLLPGCKQEAFRVAAITACDDLDGVKDGVIGNLSACHWDPHELVGQHLDCGVVTQLDADVMLRIWNGPTTDDGQRLWFGPTRGTNTTGGTSGTKTENGSVVGVPFGMSPSWFMYALAKNPGWDWRSLTTAEFVDWFRTSAQQYDSAISDDDPDLTAFRESGGKLVIWHGESDELIPSANSVDYFDRVAKAMGGSDNVDGFARLFLAPGVGHCGGGNGPVPTDPLAAVVAWAERGVAPAVLPAEAKGHDPKSQQVAYTLNLCPYPKVSRYDGHSATNDAGGYSCANGY